MILSDIRSKEINNGVLFHNVWFELRPTLNMTPYLICLPLLPKGDNKSFIRIVYNTQYTTQYRTIILPVVLYGCETWSLILRDERGLKMYENRVLRTIFVPKRDEVIRGVKKNTQRRA